ncbi:MAG: hypothetical protein EZS28_011105, partial [Streblomastix strix]
CLFVVSLPQNFDQEQARTIIEQSTGIPMSYFVLATYPNGSSRGHGWASYPSHSIAVKALHLITGSIIGGNTIVAYFARRRAFDPRILSTVRSLFVKGIPLDTTKSSLTAFVTQRLPHDSLACFKSVNIPIDTNTLQPMGHAYVHFRCKESAELGLQSLEGLQFEGKRLHVEWALPRDQRRQRRDANINNGQKSGRGFDSIRSQDQDNDDGADLDNLLCQHNKGRNQASEFDNLIL